MDYILLPKQMFVAGDEPLGKRVNPFHKPKRIASIIDAFKSGRGRLRAQHHV